MLRGHGTSGNIVERYSYTLYGEVRQTQDRYSVLTWNCVNYTNKEYENVPNVLNAKPRPKGQ